KQPVDVLRLHRDHDERRPSGGIRVGERRPDPVALVQLGEPLGAPSGRDDVAGRAPLRREQPGDEGLADLSGAEDRNPLWVYCHGAILWAEGRMESGPYAARLERRRVFPPISPSAPPISPPPPP